MNKTLKIVITDNWFADAEIEKAVLLKVNCQWQVFSPEENWQKAAKEADVLLVNMAKIDQTEIKKLKNCRLICRYGSGYDNVDAKAAEEAGIWLCRVPHYCNHEVGEHALALLLDCARGLSYRQKYLRSGKWRKVQVPWQEKRIHGSVLGIAGFGENGQAFFQKSRGLGFSHTLIYDRSFPKTEAKKLGAELVSKEELLSQSDFLSLHLPLTEKTRHFMDKAAFSILKPGCILINTARGPLIEEESLYSVLKSGKIAAAGLDVFEKEPLSLKSPLLDLENLVLSDHNAYYSESSVRDLRQKTAENVLNWLKEGKPLWPVNSPTR